MMDLECLCSERIWQLFKRIWIPLLFCVVFVSVTFCAFSFVKLDSGFSAVIASVLTAFGTYIANEVSNWHKQNKDEKIFLKSIKEELACFSDRDLDKLEECLLKSSDIQNPKYYTTYFEYKFPVYENNAGKLGLVDNDHIRVSIEKAYSVIYYLANSISFSDGEFRNISDNNYRCIQNITIEEANKRTVKLKELAKTQLEVLRQLKEHISVLVTEIEEYVK